MAQHDKHREQLLAAAIRLKVQLLIGLIFKKTTVAKKSVKSFWRKFVSHVLPKLGHRSIDKVLTLEAIKAL